MPIPRLTVALALATLATLALDARAERFLADDPLRIDADAIPAPKPAAVELSGIYDLFEHTYAYRPEGPAPRALNASTLGEVPDSSWFENRIGVRPMSVAEVVRGPAGAPPAAGRWTIIAAKSSGITPGFTIRDAQGEVYFVKFDSRRYPGLSTAADVISSRFFHAFGYHVPSNHIASFRREDLTIGEGARITREAGKKSPMTPADLDALLARVERSADGRYRAVASLRLEGEPIGPHKYIGTRPDDANDVIPHQDRREQRGLRVFAAWLNHDDSRSINSLDLFQPAGDGAGWVKHHLIDFSSTLGAGSNRRREIAPQDPRAGNEYQLERAPALRSLFTLGLWDRPWRHVPYRDFPEVGRIEAEFFDPAAWKPEYPNPAFERMDAEDGLWAALILARITDEMVRAVVHLGEFSDPVAERHLADTLIAGRDTTGAHHFRDLLPLEGFAIAGSADAPALSFHDAGAGWRLAAAGVFSVAWFTFDNRTERLDLLAPEAPVRGASVPIPGTAADYLMARIREEVGSRAVDVYLRRGESLEVVGVERSR